MRKIIDTDVGAVSAPPVATGTTGQVNCSHGEEAGDRIDVPHGPIVTCRSMPLDDLFVKRMVRRKARRMRGQGITGPIRVVHTRLLVIR